MKLKLGEYRNGYSVTAPELQKELERFDRKFGKRCTAFTLRGRRCRNKPCKGSMTCVKHLMRSHYQEFGL